MVCVRYQINKPLKEIYVQQMQRTVAWKKNKMAKRRLSLYKQSEFIADANEAILSSASFKKKSMI